MRFLIEPERRCRDWPEAHRAFISCHDGRICPTRVGFEGPVLVCRRNVSDSGKLNVQWPVEGFGRPVVTTCQLPERDEPYLLPVELARGKISQVRDQAGAWELAGMQLPDDFAALRREAHRQFTRAVATQETPAEATEFADRALRHAFEAAQCLSDAYVRQRLAIRRRKSPRLPASLGCRLSPPLPDGALAERFVDTFTAAEVPLQWRHVEPSEGDYHWEPFDAVIDWCEEHKLLIEAGPLLDLSADGPPGWLWQWEHDVLSLQSFVNDFVETAISRYLGRIRHWEVCSRVNTGGALALGEENRLMLVARALEAARQVDDETRLSIRVDQPWGEYQARGQHRLSPLQFVDALLRSGVGVSSVNLEIAVGYRPRGTGCRDSLDLSRLIDTWSLLGIPLRVTLACPSSAEPDPQAHADLEVGPGQWKEPWSESVQSRWIDECLPLLMAKEAVVGIFWSHYRDGTGHEFPHAGLVRPDGTPKPLLKRLARYRELYWQADGA